MDAGLRIALDRLRESVEHADATLSAYRDECGEVAYDKLPAYDEARADVNESIADAARAVVVWSS